MLADFYLLRDVRSGSWLGGPVSRGIESLSEGVGWLLLLEGVDITGLIIENNNQLSRGYLTQPFGP